MPISHKHNIIFVHIPKTAGGAIESALGIYGKGNRGNLSLDKQILYGIAKQGIGRYCFKRKAMQHLTAKQIAKETGSRIFKEYFKFSFVRNPYDRVVSDWLWLSSFLKEKMSLKHYLLGRVKTVRKKLFQWGLFDDHYTEQYKYIYDHRKRLLVDYLGRFENIEEDFEKICRIKNINLKLEVIHAQKRKHYKDYYDKDTKALTEELYGVDIALFGYKY